MSTTAHEAIIFNGGNLSEDFGRCVVNTAEEGQFDLYINNTRLSDSGTYTCTEYMGSAIVSHYSELVVFDSSPECDTNLTGSRASFLEENDSLLMWCFVEFRGNLNPVIEWTNGANGEISHPTANVISNKNIYSEIIVQVKYKEHDVIFSCTIHFDQTSVYKMTKNAGNRLNTTAKNIPNYNYTWTSPAFTILRKTDSFIVLENASIPTTVDPLTTSLPVSTSTIVLMICSLVALMLLFINIFCCVLMKRWNKGCFQKASAEPIVLFEANKRGRPGDRTPERLTPINVGVLPEDEASNHPAIGDTYSKLNTLDFAQTGVYTSHVLAGESASVVPSYVNIHTLEMPLHKDIVPSVESTAAALSNTAPTYENTVVVVHSIASTPYGNTVSTYENMIVSK